MYPAGEPGLSARRVVPPSLGLAMRVVETGPLAGPPVVLLPGWGGNAFLFSKNLPTLAAAGFHAIAVDPIGLGESDKPAGAEHYTLQAQVAHTIALLDALALDRVTLVGQSFGGRVALELALRHDERVGKLALIAPVGIGMVALDALLAVGMSLTPLALARLTARRGVFAAVLRMATADWRSPSDKELDEFFGPAADPHFARALYYLLKQMAHAPLRATELRSLAMPTLVIRGTRDRVIRLDRRPPPELRDWLAPRLRIVEGAGHLVNFETPEIVNPLLIDFIRAAKSVGGDPRPGEEPIT